ncbi:hypothetical protein B0O44_11226 [Pedobacter nutrimenti]|uniref:Uncharacterized protein n=1 Tax=Pedobacter nutrimenti TaxID=1241337 RepID=A0A318U7D2_9SPHI|nr:hypothetical protein B0O44_11226 [Pedobacter nutrimenti]
MFFVAVFIILAMAGMFFRVNPKLHVLNILVTILLIILIKIVNRKKHPSFLLSYTSYKLLQPRKIILKEPEDVKSKKSKLRY